VEEPFIVQDINDLGYIKRTIKDGHLKRKTLGNRMYKFEDEKQWGTLVASDAAVVLEFMKRMADSDDDEIVSEGLGYWLLARTSTLFRFFFFAMVDSILSHRRERYAGIDTKNSRNNPSGNATRTQILEKYGVKAT
jgi:hypothetical protein